MRLPRIFGESASSSGSQSVPPDVLAERVSELSEQLRGEQETSLLLEESLADLELAMEDATWRRLEADGQIEFTRAGLKQMTALCRLMALKNPLIKRGLSLRIFYVWGLGLQISARSQGGDGGEQDVNQVVQDFLDDDGNRTELTSDQAHEEKERALGTDGNVFLAAFTDPVTGRVQVTSIPFEEIEDVITDPDDRRIPWFYKRVWSVLETDYETGVTIPRAQVDFYPALKYRPAQKIKSIGGRPVHWDAPVLHVRVNQPWTGAKFGVPDAYAAIDWARSYKEFLEDWATLVRALSRFAWRATSSGSKRAKTAAALAAAPTADPMTARPLTSGATAVLNPDQTLEAIPKTGATIDSMSGRPLAMMVASALDVPVTMLLADPGQTGARATAETLDRPTGLMAEMRRRVWSAAYRDLLGYVVDQAALAPSGPLKGAAVRLGDTLRVELAGDTDRTLEIAWPPLDELDIDKQVTAIVAADGTTYLPPLVVARLLLETLGVADVDEILAEITDADGNYLPPDGTGSSAGQVAVDAFRAGQDPVAALAGSRPGTPAEPTASAPPAPPAPPAGGRA